LAERPLPPAAGRGAVALSMAPIGVQHGMAPGLGPGTKGLPSGGPPAIRRMSGPSRLAGARPTSSS